MADKCAQHEQQNTLESGTSTDIKADGQSVEAQLSSDTVVQELQHVEVNTELSRQCSEEISQGKCYFVAS